MRSQPMPRQAADVVALPRPNGAAATTTVTPDTRATLALMERLRALMAAREKPYRRADDMTMRPRGARAPFRWSLGLEAVDRHLPEEGLARAGLHDVTPSTYGDFPAASAFALALLLRRLEDTNEQRPILWCRLQDTVREYGRLYGHGAESLGLNRQRLITITLKKPQSLLWVLEEALKSGAVAGAIGDGHPRCCDLTSTRRLQLAADKGKAAGLLVFTTHHDGTTASMSRWRVGSRSSTAPVFDARAPGTPAWHLALTRMRSGRPGEWIVNWQRENTPHAPYRFNLVSGVSGGALHQGAAESQTRSTASGPALRAG
jgi:protein ImuA